MRQGLWLTFFYLYPTISYSYDQTPNESAQDATVESEAGGGLALHVWDRYVRRFRRDHNISLSIGYASARWDNQSLGDYEGKNYRTDQNSIVAEYTFHILISGKTGYYLGTSGGYVFTRPNRLDNEFQPSSSWLLPGVRAGAQLERFNDLKTHRASGVWQSASLTGESLQMTVGVDLFFALETALHLAWVDTVTYFPRPADASDFLVNARLTRRVQGGELGLLYHFL